MVIRGLIREEFGDESDGHKVDSRPTSVSARKRLVTGEESMQSEKEKHTMRLTPKSGSILSRP